MHLIVHMRTTFIGSRNDDVDRCFVPLLLGRDNKTSQNKFIPLLSKFKERQHLCAELKRKENSFKDIR